MFEQGKGGVSMERLMQVCEEEWIIGLLTEEKGDTKEREEKES